jgi:hypothetical protein
MAQRDSLANTFARLAVFMGGGGVAGIPLPAGLPGPTAGQATGSRFVVMRVVAGSIARPIRGFDA